MEGAGTGAGMTKKVKQVLLKDDSGGGGKGGNQHWSAKQSEAMLGARKKGLRAGSNFVRPSLL